MWSLVRWNGQSERRYSQKVAVANVCVLIKRRRRRRLCHRVWVSGSHGGGEALERRHRRRSEP